MNKHREHVREKSVRALRSSGDSSGEQCRSNAAVSIYFRRALRIAPVKLGSQQRIAISRPQALSAISQARAVGISRANIRHYAPAAISPCVRTHVTRLPTPTEGTHDTPFPLRRECPVSRGPEARARCHGRPAVPCRESVQGAWSKRRARTHAPPLQPPSRDRYRTLTDVRTGRAPVACKCYTLPQLGLRQLRCAPLRVPDALLTLPGRSSED
jgi:hypothetical protein